MKYFDRIGFSRFTLLCSVLAIVVLFTPQVSYGASSDYNKDGRDDILTLYDYGNANTGLITLTSGDASFTSSLAWSSGPGNWDWGRAKTVTGDYNGDGMADVLSLYDYGNANTGAIVLESNGTGFTPHLVWASGPGNWDWNRTKLAAGDFNGDGRDDILALYDYGNSNTGAIVLESNGTGFTPHLVWASGPGNWDWNRCKIAGGDYNADGYGDIMVLYDYGNANTGALVLESNGSTFTPRIAWSSGPGHLELGRTKFNVGDFNGDGRADFVVLYDSGNAKTDIKVIESTTTMPFTLKEAWTSDTGNWELGRTKLNVGDFDKDGDDDIMALYDYSNGNTGAIVLSSGRTIYSARLIWASGPGNWLWKRSNVAGNGSAPPGFDSLIYRIGASVNGTELSAVKIGNGPRRFLFVGGHHGDENQATTMVEMFGEYLRKYSESIPDNVEVWLVPCLNPDGRAAGTRWNARGVNLNRNYGTNDWGQYGVSMLTIQQEAGLMPMTDMSVVITGTPYSFNYPGPYPFSEPETQAIDLLCKSASFFAMVSVHESEDCVYWGQTGAPLAYTFAGGGSGLPVAGPISISGDATRWFGQFTGNPSITVELSSAQVDMDSNSAFSLLLPGFLGSIRY